MAYIDQIEHTYAYTLGTYAIQNEKQVSIGESTCSAIFIAKPVNVPGGQAKLHMETLTEIALERCPTARCAIQVMGDLSMQHGFYGGDFDGDLESAQDEAGEALTVSDAQESWMFHIMPDDTGTAAIWVAQRVPDDHVTVVANQFVIGEIDVNDKVNFMASDNIFAAAERNNLWSSTSGIKFNFARVYGTNRHKTSYACTRRVWRVLTMAAPSLLPIFSPYSDGWQSIGFGEKGDQPYPFSVKVDKLLSLQDIMRMSRDQFEGTVFDMTTGVDAGPFGDPMRYLPGKKSVDPINGVTPDEINAGLGFQRQISLWRTAYSSLTTSRAHLPDSIGAVTWIAPYAPHHSSFVPIYAAATSTPLSMRSGTEYKFNMKSNWWIHCLTSNYLSKWYKHTINDIVKFQKKLEEDLFSLQMEVELAALSLNSAKKDDILLKSEKLRSLSRTSVPALLNDYQNIASSTVLEEWWSFFFEMVGTYRDVYKISNPHAENFNHAFTYLTIPRWYMEQVGFWGPPGTPPPDEKKSIDIYPINVPSEDSNAIYAAKYPSGMYQPYKSSYYSATRSQNNSSSISDLIFASLVSAALGSIFTYLLLRNRKQQYFQLP